MDIPGYYNNQSYARGILTYADVERASHFEADVYARLILPHLVDKKAGTIYEAAVGPGILQCWISAHGFSDLEGSDISKNEVDLAQHFNPKVVQADAINDLSKRFSENSLSAIVALDFYEHLERDDFRKFLEVALSRLQPGGILIMRGPNADTPIVGSNLYNDITHVWAYTTVCLRALLSIAGFTRIWFCDDTKSSLHHGRWWKLPIMVVSQWLLTGVFWAASRYRIRFWGSSIYLYAQK